MYEVGSQTGGNREVETPAKNPILNKHLLYVVGSN